MGAVGRDDFVTGIGESAYDLVSAQDSIGLAGRRFEVSAGREHKFAAERGVAGHLERWLRAAAQEETEGGVRRLKVVIAYSKSRLLVACNDDRAVVIDFTIDGTAAVESRAGWMSIQRSEETVP